MTIDLRPGPPALLGRGPLPTADLPTAAEPVDVPARVLEAALESPAWAAETWPSGSRVFIVLGDREARLVHRSGGIGIEGPPEPRLAIARQQMAAAARDGGFEPLGATVLDAVLVPWGEVRLDPLDILCLDGTRLDGLPWAIRALALADAFQRLAEASAAGSAVHLRTARTPATGAGKRALAARSEPARLVLRDLRAPYGAPAAIIRVPSPLAGFFDDPWRDAVP